MAAMSSVYRILKVWTIDPQTIDNWTTVLKGYGGNIKLLLQTKRANPFYMKAARKMIDGMWTEVSHLKFS